MMVMFLIEARVCVSCCVCMFLCVVVTPVSCLVFYRDHRLPSLLFVMLTCAYTHTCLQ